MPGAISAISPLSSLPVFDYFKKGTGLNRPLQP